MLALFSAVAPVPGKRLAFGKSAKHICQIKQLTVKKKKKSGNHSS